MHIVGYVVYSGVLVIRVPTHVDFIGAMFFSHFMLFPTFIENKIWEYKTIISHLMFSSCVFCMLEILKSAPSLTATG